MWRARCPRDSVLVSALAVNDESAAGGGLVTAPTNSTAVNIPAVPHDNASLLPHSSEDYAARFFLTSSAITLQCKENAVVIGIVHAVTPFLIDHGSDITEHQQFDDAAHGHLFLRAHSVAARAPNWRSMSFAPTSQR
ncbi:hypothetical protein FGL98_00030 [Leekyejoonella antrihumi]|uniref:Serine dehydratase-like alpha subunit domain-containing protein n=1 Tax=Leekyejoonella antrihumi TaxID=1660198 RepID=A0A563E9B3_9MICO|nr:hypothetical protein FGL98_00030 [Leekyejoonella antrihumi]